MERSQSRTTDFSTALGNSLVKLRCEPSAEGTTPSMRGSTRLSLRARVAGTEPESRGPRGMTRVRISSSRPTPCATSSWPSDDDYGSSMPRLNPCRRRSSRRIAIGAQSPALSPPNIGIPPTRCAPSGGHSKTTRRAGWWARWKLARLRSRASRAEARAAAALYDASVSFGEALEAVFARRRRPRESRRSRLPVASALFQGGSSRPGNDRGLRPPEAVRVRRAATKFVGSPSHRGVSLRSVFVRRARYRDGWQGCGLLIQTAQF